MPPVPTVRLSGLSSRSGPMTWGQKTQYIAIENSGDEAYRQNLVRVVPAPAGVTTERVCEALGELLRRHEALRTYFGRAAEGGLWQRVAETVQLPLLMFDVSDDQELMAARAEVARHTFDHEAELPVRFALVHHVSGVRTVELVGSHVAVDAAGADVLALEVARSLADDPILPAPPQQPVERARWETSPAGQAVAAPNVERWRALMESGTTQVPAARGPGLRPRFWRGQLDSLALREALPALAARLRISPAALMMAGMAHVVAEEFSLASVPVRIGFNNRVRPADKVAIESLMGWGLCHLTGPGGDLASLARTAATEAFTAYTTARYDIYQVLEIADRLREAGAGETLPQFFLNVIDLPSPSADLRLDRDHLRELQAAAVFDAMPSHTRDSGGLFILQPSQVAEAVRLFFLVDSRLLAPPEMERVLRRIEGWLVDAALVDVP